VQSLVREERITDISLWD